MALDRATRNTLRNTVTRCRGLLEEAVGDVLEGRLGIRRSSEVEDAARMTHLSEEEQQHREQVISHLRHIEADGLKAEDAVARLIRETSYSHLNRLCAYKMLERRGLRREAVGRGINSQGFKFYLADHPEDERLFDTGRQDEAYRNFLRWLGGTLSYEIGVLFSPTDPANHLFPSQRVLDAVLDLINTEELDEVWDEEETIGWVYQYYTPKELREKARKESQSPRSSYELAFRNQFYTPDYVVRFLTDNTLGRTWYEMRRGNTRLTDRCEYLVRRKHPRFLAPGERAPDPFQPFPQRDDSPGGSEPADMWIRPNPQLQDLGGIFRYAQRVNGYDYAERYLGIDCGSLANERLDEYRRTGSWQGTFEELRCCLFIQQRSWRYYEEVPEGEDLEAIQSLHRTICERWELETEHILYRAQKDPRKLKVLDPACGSGHFLLYCFDLLEIIYEEAYDDETLGEALRKEHPDREAFRRAVPALILRHNLHGIDIDVRAVQIAALALWLRAQRSYADLGLKGNARGSHVRTSSARSLCPVNALCWPSLLNR
jgi:hypothetical protein